MSIGFAALLWLVTLIRLPTVMRDRRQRALWLAIITLSLAKTVDAIDAGPSILPHLFGVLAGSFLLRFVILVTTTRGLRRQAVLTIAVESALIVLAVAGGGVSTRPVLMGGRMPGATVAYWVVLEAYLGMVLIIAAVLFWTVARAAPAGVPRWGLRAMAAGAFLVAVYATFRAVLIVAHGLGTVVNFPAVEVAGQALQTTGLLLLVAGMLVPAGRRTRGIVTATRDLIVLRPLWTAVRDAFPQVILFTPRRALIELAGVDDVRLRRYRRVIEIRDGMLALRTHLPTKSDTHGRAGSSAPAKAADTPETDPAMVEARAIVAALRSRTAGEKPPERTGTWAEVGADLDDEIAWLSRVSRAYRTASREPLTAGPAPTPRPAGSAH